MRLTLVLAALAVAVVALPSKLRTDLPEPGQLAFVLNEDEFEDYLDAYLALQQSEMLANQTRNDFRSGCTFRVNGDLGQPQPVYIHRGNYLSPTGNTGQIRLNRGEQVLIACTGSGRTIRHPNVASNLAVGTVSCQNNNLVTANWLRGNSAFGQLTCSSHAYHDAQQTNTRCFNNHFVIRVGFIVNNVFYPLYWSCFDRNRLEVLYVWYHQNPPNSVFQSRVDRPSWIAGNFFPGVAVNSAYTQVSQRNMIAGFVGNALADRYVTSTQFLARGHLAAKTDFIYATGQRASFYFINAAPQWQPFNAGNWNRLEQNLRRRIGQAGYHTMVYTGTFRVTQLRNQNNRLVDIFLHRASNGALQIPVPLYFYKVVQDSSRRFGTAFISINNPYYTQAEARNLQFCTDRCRNNNAFNWVGWQPDRIDLGYSFCCTIADFRRTIPHLPAFNVNGLLT
ncbi:alkaline nuclease precursor [Bombyx mori]|uniref:Alkaline nuclease n=1 Tax=Bombyx mori TaxID=7091 RepID=Q08JX1_BOMMO|nr:alkaline nuclease precursor [Bombyx mori]BAF33251.1 alkaline nuclease [Bombyx mori]